MKQCQTGALTCWILQCGSGKASLFINGIRNNFCYSYTMLNLCTLESFYCRQYTDNFEKPVTLLMSLRNEHFMSYNITSEGEKNYLGFLNVDKICCIIVYQIRIPNAIPHEYHLWIHSFNFLEECVCQWVTHLVPSRAKHSCWLTPTFAYMC